MKKLLLMLILTNFLSGCVALVAGAAGATIANPKGTGQTITKAGEAIQKIGEKSHRMKQSNLTLIVTSITI